MQQDVLEVRSRSLMLSLTEPCPTNSKDSETRLLLESIFSYLNSPSAQRAPSLCDLAGNTPCCCDRRSFPWWSVKDRDDSTGTLSSWETRRPSGERRKRRESDCRRHTRWSEAGGAPRPRG